MNNEKMPDHFSRVTSLIGERSRAIMLWTLLDGRAYTATELAMASSVSAQAASNHLSKLVKAGLLAVETQGRHKYYRFSNDKVAQTIETIAGLLPLPGTIVQKNEELVNGIRYARTCYDHLAGRTGVLITQAMLRKKILLPQKDSYTVSPSGIKWFNDLGIGVNTILELKRKFAYPCLDWTERKHHLAGALGASLLDTVLKKDWIRRVKHSREIVVTGTGQKELNKRLGIELIR